MQIRWFFRSITTGVGFHSLAEVGPTFSVVCMVGSIVESQAPAAPANGS